MPSKNKKQLNLFKLVKSYVDNGLSGLFNEWNEIFPKRKITQKDIEKIKTISNNIKYEDLEDFVSGIVGDEVFGDVKDVKVGYWVKFDTEYEKPYGIITKTTLIVKVKQIIPSLQLAKFNPEEIYNKNGVRITPLKKAHYYTSENIWLDSLYFNQIKDIARNKKDLIMKNEIRKIVRETINEALKQDTGGLKIKKRNSDEEISIQTGMLVQKKSDESKGKVLNVGIDNSMPAKNNINIQWYYGDLSGTKQTVYPEDIVAI